MEICKLCVNPNSKDIVCDECSKAHNIVNFDDAINFEQESQIAIEFHEFLKSRTNKEILYAYSGGQDSTAVLFLLNQMCKEYNIKLNVFTIENGFKGVRTWNNIYNVIDYLQLNDNWKIYDIRNQKVYDENIVSLFGKDITVEQVYALCYFYNILPCGKVCNTMMDNQYKLILKEYNEKYLITGGDTPKIKDGKYSIYWGKNSGINVVRGGAGFRINKENGLQIIKKNNIPWINPGYGGYDTDCLVPGSIFASICGSNNKTTIEDVDRNYHVVLEYFKERVRMGIIDRDVAIESLSKLDITDYSGYVEMKNTSSKVLQKSRGM